MKPPTHLTTLGLLAVVAVCIIMLLVLTNQHNAQLKAQTELHNVQLLQQAEAHNTQLLKQADDFAAQLKAQTAASHGSVR